MRKRKKEPAGSSIRLFDWRQFFDAEHMPQHKPHKPFSIKYNNLHAVNRLLPKTPSAAQDENPKRDHDHRRNEKCEPLRTDTGGHDAEPVCRSQKTVKTAVPQIPAAAEFWFMQNRHLRFRKSPSRVIPVYTEMPNVVTAFASVRKARSAHSRY